MSTGKELKAEGQALTWEKERAEWREKASSLLYDYAVAHPSVRGDEFHTYCVAKIGEPHHPNVWGTLFTAAGRKKWMVKSKRYVESDNKDARAHTCAVWYSRACPELQWLKDPSLKEYDARIHELETQLEVSQREVAVLKGQIAELKSVCESLTRKR